jgi:hypothetical protein
LSERLNAAKTVAKPKKMEGLEWIAVESACNDDTPFKANQA